MMTEREDEVVVVGRNVIVVVVVVGGGGGGGGLRHAHKYCSCGSSSQPGQPSTRHASSFYPVQLPYSLFTTSSSMFFSPLSIQDNCFKCIYVFTTNLFIIFSCLISYIT